MLRSKRITDYIEIKLSEFQPERALPVDVHLYFERDRHIMVWRQKGEPVSETWIEKYKNRGMGRVWVYRDDQAAWERYLLNPLTATQPPSETAAAEPLKRTLEPAAATETIPGVVEVTVPAQPYSMPPRPPQAAAPTEEPRTQEGRKIIALLQAVDLSERNRTALVAKAAREIIAADNTELSREVVQEVLAVVLAAAAAETRELVPEIWKIARNDTELEHATHVSTYAVLFAMAFGRIDSALIADIALAGLLHDIGLSQVSASITGIPVLRQSGLQQQKYQGHVSAGLALLDSFAPHLPARVRAMLLQHHEKFNGTGYPAALRGFQVNDVAQLLSMADVLDTIASGQWDGAEHSLQETFALIEGMETQRSFPEHFNPEVFSAVLRWIKTAQSQDTRKAAAIVREKSREVVQRDKRAS